MMDEQYEISRYLNGAGAQLAAVTLADLLTVGQEAIPRSNNIAIGPVSGRVYWTYWTARKSETEANMTMMTSSTAAAATPTLARMGVYSVAANGDLALVASTANDTTLFAATFTEYTRAFTTPYAVIAGRRYASAVIVVTAVAAPTLMGLNLTASNAGRAPRLNGTLVAQTDLPASVAVGTITVAAQRFYSDLTP